MIKPGESIAHPKPIYSLPGAHPFIYLSEEIEALNQLSWIRENRNLGWLATAALVCKLDLQAGKAISYLMFLVY